MRLCDALRQTISEYGSGAVSGESLPELLSQRGAFDGCLGLRDAVNAFAALGLGRELSLLSHDQLAWETEVWIAEMPDHMIHLNGNRFLGPR